MTWDLFTWISIGVLIFGSVAVFVWFLRDVRRLYSEVRREGGDAGASS